MEAHGALLGCEQVRERGEHYRKRIIAAGKWQVIPVLMAERQVNRQYKGRAFS